MRPIHDGSLWRAGRADRIDPSAAVLALSSLVGKGDLISRMYIIMYIYGLAHRYQERRAIAAAAHEGS